MIHHYHSLLNILQTISDSHLARMNLYSITPNCWNPRIGMIHSQQCVSFHFASNMVSGTFVIHAAGVYRHKDSLRDLYLTPEILRKLVGHFNNRNDHVRSLVLGALQTCMKHGMPKTSPLRFHFSQLAAEISRNVIFEPEVIRQICSSVEVDAFEVTNEHFLLLSTEGRFHSSTLIHESSSSDLLLSQMISVPSSSRKRLFRI